MNKIPKLEINCIPSQLNTSPITGVASQLANVAAQEPHYDGVTIGDMRGNPLYQRIDDIDKVGLAQQALVNTTKTIKSNSKRIRAFNDAATKLAKPNAKR